MLKSMLCLYFSMIYGMTYDMMVYMMIMKSYAYPLVSSNMAGWKILYRNGGF